MIHTQFFKRASRVIAAAAVIALSILPAAAQDKYPSKAVKIIVPFSAGGATDLVARVLGEELKNILGQPFIVENKPGGFGIPAIEQMVKARPDGYTLMIGNVSTNAMAPVLFPKKFNIDYARDVMAISNLIEAPSFLLISTKDFTPRTFPEVVAFGKANSGKLRYTSAGVGSFPHFDLALLMKRAGVEAVHLPNKAGGAGMVKDLATGDAHICVVSIATAVPMIQAGHIKALAVVNPIRFPEYPDIPTMKEIGFADVGTSPWQAMFGPAKMPKEVAETLNKAVLQALKAPSVQEAFRKQSFVITPNNGIVDAQAWLKSELAKWKAINDEVKVDLGE